MKRALILVALVACLFAFGCAKNPELQTAAQLIAALYAAENPEEAAEACLKGKAYTAEAQTVLDEVVLVVDQFCPAE